MKKNITSKILFVLLIYNGGFNPYILAEKLDIWDRFDAMKKNNRGTFSSQCQDQMVRVESKIYHIDRLRWSLKSGYFERLFTSDNFKQNNNSVLEIHLGNPELFPTIIDLIHGKELWDVINGDNYFPLVEEMYYLEMEIDLDAVRHIIDYSLKTYSLQDTKLFELYDYIRTDSDFEYLLENVFKHFAKDLPTLQNHTIFPSFPLDHLILLIKKVEELDCYNEKHRIVKMCVKWLCHDMENRLPHMTELMTCVQSRFFIHHESRERRAEFIQCLRTCNVDEQAKETMITTCLFAMLAGRNLGEEKSNYNDDDSSNSEEDQRESDGYVNGYTSSTEENQNEWGEGNQFVNKRDEHAKLRKFRENCVCYDITVRVQEKSFKLHRIFLELKSNYFREIFEAEYAEANALRDEIPSCPSKDKEYVLNDEIALFGFDEVLDYIYYGEDFFLWHNLRYKVNIFKTFDILGIEEVWKKCEEKLMDYQGDVSLQNRIEILKYTYGKTKHDDLYFHYVCKELNWPEIYNVSQFYSVSWTTLENMLKSPRFRLVDLDPDNILDMFSRWICHDPQNRFHILPRIAQILNPYCEASHEEYETNSVMRSRNFSHHFIRDQLYQILSSPSYMVRSEKLPKKLEEIPVFIASNTEYPKNNVILNADLNVIASYNYSESNFSSRKPWGSYFPTSLSTTLVNDSLFTLANFDNPPTFHVYNLFLKKYFSLQVNLNWEKIRGEEDYYKLLNCNNEIYSCSLSCRVVKYSMQLNLWTVISRSENTNDYCWYPFHYTSDGLKLYRIKMYYESRFFRTFRCIVEGYDFATNLWSHVSESPSIPIRISPWNIQWTVVNNRDLAASFGNDILMSNRNSTNEEWSWRKYIIPQEAPKKDHSIFVQCENRMLVLVDDHKLYHYFLANENCSLKRHVQLEGERERVPYNDLVIIHRPKVVNQPP